MIFKSQEYPNIQALYITNILPKGSSFDNSLYPKHKLFISNK